MEQTLMMKVMVAAIGNLIAHFESMQHTELSIKMDPS